MLLVPLFSSCSLSEYIKKAVLGNVPFVKNFIQKDFNTYTSIISIKDEMKLVTAKQQLDFINIMDGKDGRYLEVSTFEVKAGIDCSKIKSVKKEDGSVTAEMPAIEIFSSNKIHSVVARSAAEENNSDFYEECIKPVNIAYEQKAKDYSVELGLLERAQEKAKETFKNLTGMELDIKTSDFKQIVELPYLPLQLEIRNGYIEENKMKISEQPKNQFNRDALILQTTSNDGWSIRIGDSGRRFPGKFNDFYETVFETNSNKNNSARDRVEIFRYFDPMYPKESEILSYSSDFYRTFFLLDKKGRIYYVDAVFPNEQVLLDDIAPSMIYLASSIRRLERNVELSDEYENYIDKYFLLQEDLRKNEDRREIDFAMNQLVKANTVRGADIEMTSTEKYVKAVSDTKNLGRTEKNDSVCLTDDSDFNEITKLATQVIVSKDSFNTSRERESAIDTALKLDMKIFRKENMKLYLDQYLKMWFLQNNKRFELSERDKKNYEDELKTNSFIASRPLIVSMSDSERNDYYYKLFRNRLSTSSKYVDTAYTIDDSMKQSVRGNNMFVYFNLPPFNEVADGDIYERMKKLNNDKEITNSFILVFNQKEFDFGANINNKGINICDDDFHAIVLDDATLRLFLNVGSLNLAEKASEKIKKGTKGVINFAYTYGLKEIVNSVSPKANDVIEATLSNKVPRFFFYGDWKNLRVTPENVSIAGHNFATKHITNTEKSAYRNTNDYAEKSVIAEVINDLQHAYSTNDADYYYDVLCEKLKNQIQHYVYEQIFRPSPRMIIDMTKDKMHRYNM